MTKQPDPFNSLLELTAILREAIDAANKAGRTDLIEKLATGMLQILDEARRTKTP